jgi:hypothetical protein
MPDSVASLVLDLLEWIGPSTKPYSEVMEAWRTSCPRLPVWEEANAGGFLTHAHHPSTGPVVSVSTRGFAHLAALRGTVRPQAPSVDP